MAEKLEAVENAVTGSWERAAENVQAQDLRFGRAWFYVTASVLAWNFFWTLADRHHDNPHVQFLAWLTVFVAVWFTNTF